MAPWQQWERAESVPPYLETILELVLGHGMSSAPLSWRGGAAITADGESQREGALSLGMCCPALCADSLAKQNRLGFKIAISAIAGVLLTGRTWGGLIMSRVAF